MSFENSDFRRDVRAEACLGACERCPELVPQLNELQNEVDYNALALRAALSDKVGDVINTIYINFNKESDDPEGRDVPELPPDILEQEVVEYRQRVATNTHQFDGYVADRIASLRDDARGCDGPLSGEIKLGVQTIRVAICNRPDAPPGISHEFAWIERG